MAQQNSCNNPNCCPIYRDNQHIKRRTGEEEVLGSNGQFCAAFYHVHQWDYRDEEECYVRTRQYFCLDSDNCIIGLRASREGRFVQPRQTVVAVVKFENPTGILYEARYTNCKDNQKHAEDFFKDDIKSGDLAGIVGQQRKGTITMYLTLQPCNESTSSEGTGGTQAAQSCCKTLQDIFETTLQPKKIGLCVKVTHTNNLGPEKPKDKYIELRRNAETGIKDLKESGVSVESMTQEDWEYLIGLTNNDSRNDLDDTVGKILTKL
jgi:pyrimidine deaminase RibD-like protein